MRDLSTFNEENFLGDLEAREWEDVYLATDMEGKVKIFNDLLMD